MKQSEWKRLSAPLAGRLSEFRRVGRGFVLDAEWVAVCLFMDESRKTEEFYLEAFLFPLFIPAESIYFNYGTRLRDRSGAQTWPEFDDQLLSLAVGATHDLRAPDPLRHLQKMGERRPLNILTVELRLCLALLLGDDAAYRKYVEVAREWPVDDDATSEILVRCHRVIDLVDLGGREAALILFADRREGTRKLIA